MGRQNDLLNPQSAGFAGLANQIARRVGQRSVVFVAFFQSSHHLFLPSFVVGSEAQVEFYKVPCQTLSPLSLDNARTLAQES
jgi:hypothetical protein